MKTFNVLPDNIQQKKYILRLPGSYVALFYFLLFTALCLLVQHLAGAYATDASLASDESAHIVNSFLIFDFLHTHQLANVLHFGSNYYEHFPRVSIGHWPPFYYMVQTLILMVFGRSIIPMLFFQSVTAGLAAAVTGAVVRRQQGGWVGLAAGLMTLSAPVLLFQLNAVMIDIFLGLLILLTTLAWTRYVQTVSWRWGCIFAGLASCAILSKGNALGLALLPLLYCLLRWDFSILKSRKTWFAALIVGGVTFPWYIISYRFASDAFAYSWGWSFVLHALGFYAQSIFRSFGFLGGGALLLGVLLVVRKGRLDRNELLVSLVSSVGALYLFLLLIPSGIEDRLLIPLIPSAVIIAVYGLGAAVQGVIKQWWKNTPPWTYRAILFLAIVLNVISVIRIPSLTSLNMDKIAQVILNSHNGNPLVLVSGCSRAEGALIASFAQDDISRAHYIIRGFKSLASDDYMGMQYRQRFQTVNDLSSWLTQNYIGWIVVDTSPESMELAHTRQLVEYLESNPPHWKLYERFPHRCGETRLYCSNLPTPSPAPIQKILQQVTPLRIIGHAQPWAEQGE